MVPVKIECGCGQRYAFDVEPFNGRMPVPVNCPACGMEGTAAANEAIAYMLEQQTAAIIPLPIPGPTPPPLRA